MKTFISAEDIETLAAQGARELTVDEDTVLTALAREAAAQFGIKLVQPGQASAARGAGAGAIPASAAPAVSGGKPKGCQHGPPGSGGAATRAATTGGGAFVNELIGAVKQLARAPGAR